MLGHVLHVQVLAGALIEERGERLRGGRDLAGRHGRRGVGRRTPPAHHALADAHQARRRQQDEGDEDQAEEQQPVFGVLREVLAKQQEEQGADQGAGKAAHAADQHHRQQFTRERHGQHFSRGDPVIEHRQTAGQAGHRRRDDEGGQLVLLHRVAEKARALLVFADGDQHLAKGRVHQTQHEHAHDHGDHRDEHIKGPGIVELESKDRASLDAAQTVLAAGQRRPAVGDGEGQCAQRQGEQREIHALATQDDGAQHQRGDQHQTQRQDQRGQHRVGEEALLQDSHCVAAQAEPGTVSERHQPSVTQEQVQAQADHGQQHAVDGGGHGQTARLQDKGQQDQAEQHAQPHTFFMARRAAACGGRGHLGRDLNGIRSLGHRVTPACPCAHPSDHGVAAARRPTSTHTRRLQRRAGKSTWSGRG